LKKKVLGLTFLTIMLAMPMITSSVEATNWVEVTRFTGSGTTDYFTCEHVEWRIRWEYTPSKLAAFTVFVYEQGEDVWYIDSVFKTGDEETSGVSHIHNQKGTFYMDIDAANIENFTVIIEQDVDSIPEFTPATIAIVLVAVSVLAVALSKKVDKMR
jgi:hypothetical protein